MKRVPVYAHKLSPLLLLHSLLYIWVLSTLLTPSLFLSRFSFTYVSCLALTSVYFLSLLQLPSIYLG